MLTLSRFLRRKITRRNNSLWSQALSARDSGVSFLKRMQYELLAERYCTTTAALIEAPQRVQPNQSYVLRIHLMGNNEPKKDVIGLGTLVQGELVRIEVRSALSHSDAYLVQQANVYMPGSDQVVVVTVPMLPLVEEASERYQRLRISFLNEFYRPLYTSPFALDVYVSRLVTFGSEGYNAVRIPV